MKRNQQHRHSGLTLIEMLTVISIMALLGTIAFPAIKNAMIRAQMVRAAANVRSIVVGLRSYASDNSGVFPVGENDYEEEIATSNDAFRSLVPDYIDQERVFVEGRSAWGRDADNRMDDPAEILKPGENHYAYVMGLFDTSGSNYPLVADGTNGSGMYVSELGQKGGCWEARKAIVGFVGGSASIIRLRGDMDGERFVPRDGYPEENALDVGYMGAEVVLLDPAE